VELSEKAKREKVAYALRDAALPDRRTPTAVQRSRKESLGGSWTIPETTDKSLPDGARRAVNHVSALGQLSADPSKPETTNTQYIGGDVGPYNVSTRNHDNHVALTYQEFAGRPHSNSGTRDESVNIQYNGSGINHAIHPAASAHQHPGDQYQFCFPGESVNHRQQQMNNQSTEHDYQHSHEDTWEAEAEIMGHEFGGVIHSPDIHNDHWHDFDPTSPAGASVRTTPPHHDTPDSAATKRRGMD
jgi:hypothetical protein